MRTATRGAAALITLGVLLSQAPMARAYEFVPREGAVGAAPTSGPPEADPTAAPSSEISDRAEPTTAPTEAPSTPPPADDPDSPAEPPVAQSWSELAGQVAATSPSNLNLRVTAAEQSQQVMRCFKLETENYCLGLGFVDKLPTGAEISSTVAEPDTARDDLRAGVSAEQDIATGALSPAAFVAERAEMNQGQRTNAELDEMQAAWDGRDKARALRELDAEGNPPAVAPGSGEPAAPGSSESTAPGSSESAAPDSSESTAPGSSESAAPGSGTTTSGRTGVPAAGEPSGGQTVVPKPGDPSTKPAPPPLKPPAATKPKPASNYIMKGYQTSQDKGYWCGPATFQSIDWADDKQKDTQASWAKDLGATTSGTAISAMVKQTNLKTNWDLAAGTYIVQNVSHWTPAKFLQVHQNHLGDAAPAPVIEHVQLLKRYFPYLAFNHSGHYQVGRGYDMKAKTVGIYEVFNERRFNSRGNVTDGPRNIPATAMFNATLANAFKNIGL